MSHRATNWAFQQRGLRPAARVVLLYLADRHNPDHGCFPSQVQLAADCEISRSGLNNVLDELERMGLMRRERRVNVDTHKQMSTRYILGFEDEFTQEPCPKSGHGNHAEPSPEIAESRVQNLDTNPVREPVTTTAHARVGEAVGLCLDACGAALTEASRRHLAERGAEIDDWLAEGLDLERDVLPALRARCARPVTGTVRTWGYFGEVVRSAQARRAAQAKSAQKAENQPVRSVEPDQDPLSRLAAWLNSGRHVPPSAVTNTARDQMLARGLVTEATLRARQIY